MNVIISKKHLLKAIYAILGVLFAASWVKFCFLGYGVRLDLTLAFLLISIVLLATGVIMEYLTMLLFMSAIILIGLAPQNVTFSGFASDGFWLIFAGIPLSMAIKKTGLADRISLSMRQLFTGGYFILILGMTLFGLLLAFIMPSGMGRTVLMLPILIEFALANGYEAGSKGYTGILLAGVFSSYLAGFAILPSNLPNIILMGAMHSSYHQDLTYGHYFWLSFPVLGLIKLLLLSVVTSKLFHELPSKKTTQKIEKHSPLSKLERRLSLYLILVLLAWLSDSYTHLSPAWPALVAGVVCLLPKVGIFDHKHFFNEAKIEPLFYVGGLIGVSAVVSYTGLGTVLGDKVLALLPLSPGHNWSNYCWLSLLTLLVGTITTLPGVPAIMTPLASTISNMTHLPLMTVFMTQVVGFSTFILPYQAPPILVALRMSELRLAAVTKLCLVMLVLTLVLVMPLNYLWWKLLGTI